MDLNDPLTLLNRPATRPGIGMGPAANAPVGPSEYDTMLEKQRRQDSTSTMDVIGSIWRQDSLTDGFMGELAGSGMEPQQDYNPVLHPTWKALSEGIPEDMQKHLLNATSPAQAFFIRDRLLQKMQDLQRLDDLGLGGNIGRLALNVLMPDQLLMGMMGGWVARGLQGAAKASTLTQVATAAKKASSAPAVAAGVAFGAAENVAYEKLRQSVNFESDDAALLTAGLLGAGFTAPFALAGARSAGRVARAAEQELNVLSALRDAADGKPLSESQVRTIKDTAAKIEAVKKLDSGLLSDEEFVQAYQGFVGPIMPFEEAASRASADVSRSLRETAQSIIDEFHADRAPRIRKPGKLSARQQAELDQLVQAETYRNFPHLRPDNPPVGSDMADQLSALKAKLDAARERPIPATEKVDPWAAVDLEKRKQTEEAYRQRDLQDAAKPPAEPAPVEPLPATPEAPAVDPKAPPVGHPAEPFVGTTVTFDHPKTGEPIEGSVLRLAPNGKLVVQDAYTGNLVAVEHTRVDQFKGEAPAGFLGGSVGAAQVLPLGYVERMSSVGTGYLTVPGTNGALKVPPRFDLYAFLNESKVDGVRALGHKLVKDPVFQRDGSAQDMTATEWKSHLRRTVAGTFHRETADAYKAAVEAAKIPLWQRAAFRRDFYEAAGPLLRGDDSVLQRFDPAVHSHLQAAAAAMRKAYDKLLDEAQKAGVKGAQGVAPNEAYVNRIWRQDKIREAMAVHGEDRVYQLLANAMTGLDKNGPLTGDVAKAKSFLKTVMRLEWSPALQNVHLAGRDMATLRGELRAAGLADSDINHIVDVMFEVRETAGTDAGQAPNLRFRFDLDETIRMQTPAGELKLADLLENDSRMLVDRYTDSMAGHVALAKVGITSEAEWMRQLKMVDEEVQGSPVEKAGRYQHERQWLESIHKNLLGRPMHTADFSSTARFAAAFRGYARSTMLGQLGLTAAFEMKQAIGVMGMRAFLANVPSFRGFLQALRRGYLPEEGLARDVMMIGGWGQEKASAYARAREIDEHLPADILGKAERGANLSSHAVDVISGNASFTSLTKQLSAMMSVQRLYDHAVGHAKLDEALTKRLAGQGLEGQYLQDVMAQLKQFSDVDNGRVTGIRYEDWLAHDVDAYNKFQLYMSRQVRDSIQDQDLGETIPFMHSTLGKVFSELKTFFLVAHAKNFVKNAAYADSTTLQVLLVGMMGEAMGYSIQQAINNPDKLQERLSPDVMGPAVMARLSSLGFMPMLAETGYQILTGESLLQPGVTSSGTNNRNLFVTPSMMAAQRLWAAPQVLTQGLLGTDTVTQKEVKDVWNTVPGFNTYGFRGIGNWLAESFPKSGTP